MAFTVKQIIIFGSLVGAWAFVLPSLITQLNWLSPSGLLPIEERRKWLAISWVIVILITTCVIVWGTSK